MEAVDCLIEPRWIVPIEPAGVVLEGHVVAVRDRRIVAVVPAAEADARFAPETRCALRSHVLLPGLVNLHTHAAMTLMRGVADDRSLMTWLKEHILHAELRHVSPEFVYDGTLLASGEMLRGGVTCVNDMYFFPDSAAQAFHDAGMRASVGLIAVEFPSPYAADAEDYLTKGLALRDRLRDDDRLSFCMAPHAAYTVSDRTFQRIATLAEELDLPIHVHVHETADEVRESVVAHGKRPLERLAALGLVTERLIAVHAIHLTPGEVALLARSGASVAHCPSSNLKLASGLAPIAELLAQRINVGLGTDGAASNNRLDLFQEMRTAALLAKAVSGSAEAMPAHEALRCATLGGARALGLERKIGSIEAGKQADLCALSLADPETQPCYDPASQAVYACGREHVTHVWVDGERVVDNGQLTRLDARELAAKAAYWKDKIRS